VGHQIFDRAPFGTQLVMGTGPIRTALKVDFNKSAQEQPYLHVRLDSLMAFGRKLMNTYDRIAGIRIVLYPLDPLAPLRPFDLSGCCVLTDNHSSHCWKDCSRGSCKGGMH